MRVLVGLSLALSILAGGCVADDSATLYIEGQLAPTRDANEVCLYSTEGDFQVAGSMNVGNGPLPYILTLKVDSTVINRSSELRSDPNPLTAQSFEIEVKSFNGSRFGFPGLPNPFLVPASSPIIDSRDSDAPKIGIVSGNGLPAPYSEALASLVSGTDGAAFADVTLVANLNARTLGDTDIKSDDWNWNVTVFSDITQLSCPLKVTNPYLCRPGQDGAPLSNQFFQKGTPEYATFCEDDN